MGTNLMGELVANNGTFIINSADQEVYLNIDAIVVLEDTIFSGIYIGENGAQEVRSTYLSDVTGVVKAGAIITPINDVQFTGVYVASGSVALVLG